MRLCAAVAGVFALLAVAGCGGGAAALDPVAQAADRTSERGTSRMSMTLQMTDPSLQRPVGLRAEGVVDQQQGEVRLELDFSDIGRATGVSGDFSGEEIVLENRYGYLRMPYITDELPAGKEWVRFDFGRDAGAGILGTDPTNSLAALRASSGRVEELGREMVRGDETTHYRAYLDAEKVAARLPKALRAKALRALRRKGDDHAVDVWIDDGGLVRRVADRDADGTETTIEFWDFGVAVDVEAPPAEKVVDSSEVEGLRGP